MKLAGVAMPRDEADIVQAFVRRNPGTRRQPGDAGLARRRHPPVQRRSRPVDPASAAGGVDNGRPTDGRDSPAAGDDAAARGVPGPGSFTIVAPTPGQPHASVVAELVETLLYGLRALGHPTAVAHGRYGSGVNLLLSPTFAREPLPPPPPRTIVYNLEQFDPSSTWFPERVRRILRELVVWDYSAKNLQSLQAAGLALRGLHVPVGYTPELTRIRPAAQQDIDVLFYGSMNARREAVLRRLGRQGLKVMHAFNAYGDTRDALIARAKVVLNIHYYEAHVFEIVRVSYLLANSKAVVTEIGADTDLDEDLADAVAGVPYERVADAAASLVRDDELRHALEGRGFRAFSQRREAKVLEAALAGMCWT